MRENHPMYEARQLAPEAILKDALGRTSAEAARGYFQKCGYV